LGNDSGNVSDFYMGGSQFKYTDSPCVIHGFYQLFQANDRVLPYMSP